MLGSGSPICCVVAKRPAAALHTCFPPRREDAPSEQILKPTNTVKSQPPHQFQAETTLSLSLHPNLTAIFFWISLLQQSQLEQQQKSARASITAPILRLKVVFWLLPFFFIFFLFLLFFLFCFFICCLFFCFFFWFANLKIIEILIIIIIIIFIIIIHYHFINLWLWY